LLGGKRLCSKAVGIYFNETFSPVVKLTIVRVIRAPITSHDLELEQIEVKKNYFLHGDLEE